MATKRQHNHAVKVYEEQWRKAYNKICINPDNQLRVKKGGPKPYKFTSYYYNPKRVPGYNPGIVRGYIPQGKREGRKYHLLSYTPAQLSVLYKDNPYIHFGPYILYLDCKEGQIINVTLGKTLQYNESLGKYELITNDLK